MTTGWNEVAWNEVVMERSDRNSMLHVVDWGDKEACLFMLSKLV